jgi:pSer/pThr/pTyr-binding forkhead associated (FHA) protein
MGVAPSPRGVLPMMPSIKLDDEPIGLLSVTVESERSCYIITKSMGQLKVGRHSICDIQINHSSVSRDHFAINIVSSDRIEETGNEYRFELEDSKSFNKTKLNNEIVDKGVLKDGDIIEVGMARLRFHSLVGHVTFD